MSDGPFAPADLLAAVAIAALGDLDVPDGEHVRVMPSPLLGFPIAPFGLYRIRPQVVGLEDVLWRDREGSIMGSGNLAAAGGYLTADWTVPSGHTYDVAVQVVSDETLEGVVTLLDRTGDRVVARASREPFIVAGPRVDRIRVEGHAGGPLGLLVWRVSGSLAMESIINDEPDLLSLPIDGEHPWYSGGLGAENAMRVVRDGAPRRLGPPDRPDGPLDGLTPVDEELRVGLFRDRLVEACEQLVADPGTWPAQVRTTRDEAAGDGKPRQVIDVSVASSLLAEAMDPGLGRFLGLVGQGHGADPEPAAYAVIGLFPIDRRLVLPAGRALADLVDSFPASVGLAAEAFARRVGADQLVHRLTDDWGPETLSVAGLVALAGAVPPPDRPTMPQPVVGSARWLDGKGQPSQAFRQDLLIDAAPLGSLVALARSDDGGWTTRHAVIELPSPAEPRERAVAMLLGRTGERPPLVPRGLVTDAPVPAGPGVGYRVSLADLFGRFGEPAEQDVSDPPRPLPPAPAPQVEVVLDGPDGNQPGAASPGHIVVRVPVPSVAERAAGSLPITGMQFDLQGDTHEVVDIQPPDRGTVGIAEDRFNLPALAVGERRTLTLGGVFIDSASSSGPVRQVPVIATDRRRPPTLVTARGIVWTSRPGPAPEVELRLSWPGATVPAGVGYRAYLADATSLGLRGTTRAEVAKAGGDRDEAGTLGGRDRFRLLTEPPLVAGPDGRVTLVELLPRSLASVQFLRIVPVSAAGREAEFDRCRAIPVAVPTDRRPPAPRVHAVVDEDGGRARIRIEAVGLDLVALRAAEPGLFTDPVAADVLWPEFRLRRAAGPVGDPLYAREIARGHLVRTTVDGSVVFAAEVEDPHELAPFVRYSYWAEVRMPAERRLVRGADVETPPAGGVVPLDPAQLGNAPGPFSPPSPPTTVMGPAATVVTTLDAAVAAMRADAGMLRLSLTAPTTPAAHPLATPGYRLRLWERWGAGDIDSAGPDLAMASDALDWEGSPRPDTPAARPAALLYAIVDPLGQVGPVQELPAPLDTWEPIGGLFTSVPAACAPGSGGLAAFGAGLDRRLYWRRADAAGWGPGWDPISADLIAGPIAAVALPDGSIVVAFRIEEDARYYRYDGATWAPWQAAGWFTTGVALTALGANAVQAFVTRYRRVWSATWNGTAWSAFQVLPEPLQVDDVAAVASEAGTDIAVRGGQRVHHRALVQGVWGPWTPLDGLTAASAPAIARLSAAEVVVLAQGPDTRLYWNRVRHGVATGWTRVATGAISGPPAATSPSPGRLDVFVRGTDNAMYHRWFDGTWHP